MNVMYNITYRIIYGWDCNGNHTRKLSGYQFLFIRKIS